MTTTTPPIHSHRIGRTLAVAALSGALLTGGVAAPASAVSQGDSAVSVASKQEKPDRGHGDHKPDRGHGDQHHRGPFKDVPAHHPYAKSIKWVKDRGILHGYRDGTFRPNKAMNRAEVADALYRYAGSPKYNAPKKSPFRDVRKNHPHYKQIAWAEAKGLLQDHGGWFNPDRTLSHGETASAYYKFAGSPRYHAPRKSQFKDVSHRDRHYKEIHWAKEVGIFKGHKFEPRKATTRGELSENLYNWWKTWR